MQKEKTSSQLNFYHRFWKGTTNNFSLAEKANRQYSTLIISFSH